MTAAAKQVITALAALTVAAEDQAAALRGIAANRTDGIDRAVYLAAAARWQRLHDHGAAALEAHGAPS